MEKGLILAGDVGGTKTILALYQNQLGGALVHRAIFGSREYASLIQMIDEFRALARRDEPIQRAAFGVAGPVDQSGYVRLTNLPYDIDAHAIESALGIREVLILNDLEATAYGVQGLEEEDFFPLQEPAQLTSSGGFVVIAPGTGLGEATAIDVGQGLTVIPGEGGHGGLAPFDTESLALLDFYFRVSPKRMSAERFLSGDGLGRIHRFYREARGVPSNVDLEAAADPNVAITEAALKGTCEASVLALALFWDLLASRAGDLALRTLPEQGVFIAGGIARRTAETIDRARFRRFFTDKGRFTRHVAALPVQVILSDETPLLGAAAVAISAVRHGEHLLLPRTNASMMLRAHTEIARDLTL